MTTTASYSPRSNGTCVITNMLHKVYDDARCDYVSTLAWAINAKKSLINNNGFSPSQ